MTKKARATLMEIAKAANVSATTVSNVVNGRLHLMSDETRRRIEQVIQKHNYRPNEEARNLRLAQRRTVGLIVIDDSPTFLADPMITNITAGMSNFLSASGYSLLISGMTYAAIDSAHMLRRDQTDAICLIPSGAAAERRRLYAALRRLNQPLVVFQDQVPDDMDDAVSIRQDNLKAGRLIGGTIRESGARRIAFLAPARTWPALVNRQAGLREATAPDAEVVEIVCASESVADTRQALDRHMDRHQLPEAIVGGNDQMAITAMNWATDRGLRIPADLRIAGFNGFDVFSYARPSLTTVVSPAYEMGRRGAELLLRRLSSGAFDEREHIFDVALRVGASA